MQEATLKKILIAKFIDIIPHNYKIHLLSQKVTKFNNMVEVLNNFQVLLTSVDS